MSTAVARPIGWSRPRPFRPRAGYYARGLIWADYPATFPPEGRIEDWSFTRERDAADVNADVRRMVDETGYCLFKIGCRFDEIDDGAAG
ncbi:hypothetical protein [Caulobacter sp. CCUG 60055]|uniref:hypothetical protein n=1 Tax=Caulobacter sp. CCUG 60055 TaxID=2100090 RepID=UPI001FA80044|nr:hypothetical protein [Caulobacter sp. CCUG 60055]